MYLQKWFESSKASIEDSTLKVVYANPKFSNPVISSGRALRVLNEIAPSKINKLSVAEVNGGLGLFEAEIDRGSLDRSLKYKDPSLLYDSLEETHSNIIEITMN